MKILTLNLSEQRIRVFRGYFAMDGLELIVCPSIDEVITEVIEGEIPLIIIDACKWTLDETQEAIGLLRKDTYIPLLVLTTSEATAAVLEVGADVCIPHSASNYAMFSQAMAMIRRYTVYNHFHVFYPDKAIVFRGDLMVDSMRHRVTVAGNEVTLLPREFRLLAFFVRNPGIALSQEQLGEAIWLGEHDANRDVMKIVSNLRQKLGDNKDAPKYIETLRGVGYRFIPQ